MANILFLCTGNSARSIIAEAIYNYIQKPHGYGHAFSAGSKPVGAVNPYALQTLTRHGVPTYDAYSKPLSDFLGKNAPTMDTLFPSATKLPRSARPGQSGRMERPQSACSGVFPIPPPPKARKKRNWRHLKTSTETFMGG